MVSQRIRQQQLYQRLSGSASRLQAVEYYGRNGLRRNLESLKLTIVTAAKKMALETTYK